MHEMVGDGDHARGTGGIDHGIAQRRRRSAAGAVEVAVLSIGRDEGGVDADLAGLDGARPPVSMRTGVASSPRAMASATGPAAYGRDARHHARAHVLDQGRARRTGSLPLPDVAQAGARFRP
ncbi:MAG: hypothetical protein U1E17_06070 [Geminicoccaceae bacterium]